MLNQTNIQKTYYCFRSSGRQAKSKKIKSRTDVHPNFSVSYLTNMLYLHLKSILNFHELNFQHTVTYVIYYFYKSIKSFIEFEINKTKSIEVSEAIYLCIWFLNGGIINSYQ